MPARGPSDFGWDPIFETKNPVSGELQTYAEMNKSVKHSISHRCVGSDTFAAFFSGTLCDDGPL